jgi:hypothetical protein
MLLGVATSEVSATSAAANDSASPSDAVADEAPAGVSEPAKSLLFLHRKGAAPSDQGPVVVITNGALIRVTRTNTHCQIYNPLFIHALSIVFPDYAFRYFYHFTFNILCSNVEFYRRSTQHLDSR